MPTALSTPSSSLPPLSRLSASSAAQIYSALDDLCQLYWPLSHSFPSRLAVPTRKHLQTFHDDSVPDSGYASAEEADTDVEEQSGYESEEETADILRVDLLERTFATKWVTGFIARSDAWVAEGKEEDVCESEMRAKTIEKAISLLSAFSGNSDDDKGAGQDSVTRSFFFPTPDCPDIHVELNDAPLSDVDHTSVGLQSWASSIILAERMCAFPFVFMLEQTPSARVLELGAGTGLLSITAAKILQWHQSSSMLKQPFPLPHVVATDYHPAVLSNLAANISTNFPRSPFLSAGEPEPVSVLRLDWESPDYSLFEGQQFDVIFAADVIYHPQHARWIKVCVEWLLTRPSSEGNTKGGYFWLIMPLRIAGRHQNIDRTVEEMFPDVSAIGGTLELAILERESFPKQRGVGRADEGGSKLFKIGWVS